VTALSQIAIDLSDSSAAFASGYVEAENIIIEYRCADGMRDRLRECRYRAVLERLWWFRIELNDASGTSHRILLTENSIKCVLAAAFLDLGAINRESLPEYLIKQPRQPYARLHQPFLDHRESALRIVIGYLMILWQSSLGDGLFGFVQHVLSALRSCQDYSEA
jgi:hypothetical protein